MEIHHFLGGIYPSNVLYPYPKVRKVAANYFALQDEITSKWIQYHSKSLYWIINANICSIYRLQDHLVFDLIMLKYLFCTGGFQNPISQSVCGEFIWSSTHIRDDSSRLPQQQVKFIFNYCVSTIAQMQCTGLDIEVFIFNILLKTWRNAYCMFIKQKLL